MKKIIYLLFVTLLSSFLIVSCGSSSSDDGLDNTVKTVTLPSGTEKSITLASDAKPEIIPGCESGLRVPGCK
jgi:hypothetical protein